MVLMYRGFEGSKVFKWCRGNTNRVTVMFPAEPFFDRCVERVLQEHHQGHAVLAWGDGDGLERLKAVLNARHIPAVPFEHPAGRQKPRLRKEADMRMNLL